MLVVAMIQTLTSTLFIVVRSWLTTLLLLPLSEELQVLLGHKLSTLYAMPTTEIGWIQL